MIPKSPGFWRPRIDQLSDFAYLVSVYVGGTVAGQNWDKTYVQGPNYTYYQNSPSWMLYAFQASFGGSDSYTNAGPVTQEYFNINDRLHLIVNNQSHSSDSAEIDIEFLTASDTVRAALRCRRSGSFTTTLEYGVNLSSLTAAGGTGSFPIPHGHITFTSTSLIFTKSAATNYRNSFTLGSLTMSDVAKIRYTNVYSAAFSITGNSQATIMLRKEQL